jgi:hypothetical protein
MEDTETVERRGRTRGEKRDLTSKGVLKGPSCVKQKKGKEREFGGEQRWAARVFQGLLALLRSYFASTNHGDASSFGSMPEASTYLRNKRTLSLHAKRYLILCCVAHGAGLYASTSKRPCSR